VIGHKKEALPRGSVPSGEPLAYNGDAPESKSGRFFGMVNVLYPGVAELLAAGGINDKKGGPDFNPVPKYSPAPPDTLRQ